MRFFQGLFKARDKPVDGRPQNALGGSRYSFFFGNTTSGKPVTERTAMQMTAVYSCVRILSEAVAGLPIHVYRYTDNGGKEKALEHPLYRLQRLRADRPQRARRGHGPLSAHAEQNDR